MGALVEGRQLVDTLTLAARVYTPDFIVVLGDVLDTHEVVRVPPHALAHDMIAGLSAVAPTFVLMGNHDLASHTEFLSPRHIFAPFTRWDNVWIVDTPVRFTVGGCAFVACPYVPPGRFRDALDTLTAGAPCGAPPPAKRARTGAPHSVVVAEGPAGWRDVIAIFAHQEFRGATVGGRTSRTGARETELSTRGDPWGDAGLPPVISGHIHQASQVRGAGGGVVHYPGTPLQHSFGDTSEKRVWLASFTPGTPFVGDASDVERLDLRLPRKVKWTFSIDAMHAPGRVEALVQEVDRLTRAPEADEEEGRASGCSVRLELTGGWAAVKAFRATGEYRQLARTPHLTVRLHAVEPEDTVLEEGGGGAARDSPPPPSCPPLSFTSRLHELAAAAGDGVVRALHTLDAQLQAERAE